MLLDQSIYPVSINVSPALRVAGVLEHMPAGLGRRSSYTVDKLPVHCRATLQLSTRHRVVWTLFANAKAKYRTNQATMATSVQVNPGVVRVNVNANTLSSVLNKQVNPRAQWILGKNNAIKKIKQCASVEQQHKDKCLVGRLECWGGASSASKLLTI